MAECVPRLRPRSVGQPTAPQVVVEARGTRDHVFSCELESKGQLPQEVEADLQLLVQTQLRGREALWCFGNTGVGKSRRIPLAALTVEDDTKGVAHIMPMKIAVSLEALEAQCFLSCFFNPGFVIKEQFLRDWMSAVDEPDQSVSTLIFAAGGSQELCLPNTRLMSPRLCGNCPLHMESEALERMTEHDFNSDCPAFFLILTPGKGEDSWTPRPNAVMNCSEQIDLDDLGFLSKGKSDNCYPQQREGRVGRVADSLVLHLGDVVEPVTKWVMPYAEILQACLAAMDLGVVGELPDLNAAQQEETVD